MDKYQLAQITLPFLVRCFAPQPPERKQGTCERTTRRAASRSMPGWRALSARKLQGLGLKAVFLAFMVLRVKFLSQNGPNKANKL